MKKLKFKPSAVIFDMDGVIVDSMPYHYISWYEALSPYGVQATAYDVYSREGEKWQKTLEDLFKRENMDLTPKLIKSIFKKRRALFKKYFKRNIFHGAKEFLNCIKQKGYLLALVTGTPEREIKRILPKYISGLFDAIIAGDHVKKGKPDPDPYLAAAKKLKLKPSKCVVIENAPFGIESAKKAGMFCFAVTTSLPKEYLSKADIIVDELAEITGIIDLSCKIR